MSAAALLTLGRRVLVLAPHPDDEAVGCAIAARRASAAGASIFVLYLTTGVPARDVLFPWQRRGHAARVLRRRAEARRAAELLGAVPAGFADWPSRTLKCHLAEAFGRIEAALAKHAIDCLWAPAWEGGHQDHDTASFLAARCAGRLPIVEFAEYNFRGGRVRSQEFPEASGAETRLVLDAEEAVLKRRVLEIYASERGNLRHVRCEIETLRPLAAYDYRRRPHPGRLFYERFHWVPFRHPRIDLVRPDEVCATLAAASAEAEAMGISRVARWKEAG